jgi:signal transduction histidine kinase
MDDHAGCARDCLYAEPDSSAERRQPGVPSLAGSSQELAQIVHDLKNPLSSIALEIELMADRGTPELTPSLARMRRNVWFLDRLIYNLVDLCSLTNGRLVLCRGRCDLTALLTDVVDRIVPSRERERVMVEVGEPTTAMIDALRIERVIANLLDNALKYTPKDGAIVVRMTSTARDATISVCDTGPGLQPDELAAVFEPYQRATSSRGRRGSGLGLHVSKQIVEAHGGHIGVESVRRLGTRFYFTLPLAA